MENESEKAADNTAAEGEADFLDLGSVSQDTLGSWSGTVYDGGDGRFRL